MTFWGRVGSAGGLAEARDAIKVAARIIDLVRSGALFMFLLIPTLYPNDAALRRIRNVILTPTQCQSHTRQRLSLGTPCQ